MLDILTDERGKQTDRHTNRQTPTPIYIQTNKQTQRQKHIPLHEGLESKHSFTIGGVTVQSHSQAPSVVLEDTAFVPSGEKTQPVT